MDSNFSVKITADISDLTNRLKSVEQTLGNFKQSADAASTGMARMNNEGSRGRLVAFAFGQVIRDAGFFANDFGLGLLAISNNIPILIDQLVMMSNVSKGLGVALSLAGSVITAALTVVAYTMMYTKKAQAEFTNELSKNTGEAQKNALVLTSLLNIAKNESLSLRQRQDAVNQINKDYKEFNGTLTVSGASSEKTATLVDKLTKSMILNAEATALANEYSRMASEMFKMQNTPLAEQADLLDKATVYWRSFLDFINPFTGKNNPILDFTEGARAGLNKFGLENFTSKTKELSGSMQTLRDRLSGVLEKITGLGLAGGAGGKSIADVYKELNLELKKVNSNLSQSFTEKSRARANAYQKAIEALIEMGLSPASKEIEQLQLLAATFNYDAEGLKRFENGLKSAADGAKKVKEELAKTEKATPLAIPEQDLPPIFDALNADKGKMTAAKIKAYADGLMPGVMEVYASIAATITDGMADVAFAVADGIGKMLTGEMGIADFGRSILASIGSFLSQLGKQMMAFGIAALLFGKVMLAIAAGGPAAMIALAPGLIAAGAALAVAGSVVSSLASGKKGNAAMAGGGGINTGGFTSQFTTPMSNAVSSSMYGRYNGTLETRVSGNDLVILMNRADRNRRGNY